MKPCILVVDDIMENRQILLWRLRKIGEFEIREASNGREAVRKFATQPPDLILMDLRMPLLDGLGATREIRAREVATRVPIIAVTAQAMPDDTKRALEAGCDAYVSKPYNYAQLEEMITAFLAVGTPQVKVTESSGCAVDGRP